MTKHTDSSRFTDSGVSGNAQTRAREIRKVAYVGRNGIWPNTVTCEKHSTKENWDDHCRVMSAMNTTAWPAYVETELPCVFCEFPTQPCTDEVSSGVE